MSSLFESLGNQGPAQMIAQIKQNPVAFLSRAGLNVPQGMTDPDAILNHLMQSGQVSQDKYNRVMQMVSQVKR